MKILGTDFVMFNVTDMPEAVRFYRETLGLTQEVDSDEFCEFDCGNVTLSLLKDPDAGKALGQIAFAVDDVQAAYVELKDKGVRFENEPQDYSCCKAVLLRDPDGNYVTLHRRADGTVGQQEATG